LLRSPPNFERKSARWDGDGDGDEGGGPDPEPTEQAAPNARAGLVAKSSTVLPEGKIWLAYQRVTSYQRTLAPQPSERVAAELMYEFGDRLRNRVTIRLGPTHIDRHFLTSAACPT
jgi:hypothetical protein